MSTPARSRGSSVVLAERSSLARQILLPAQSVMHSRVVSGVMLLASSIVALLWANSRWSQSYTDLRSMSMSLDLGFMGLSLTLEHWVNGGLMTIFFFAVGLEIKREFLHGELNTWKKAALPVFGAVGGMVLPSPCSSLVWPYKANRTTRPKLASCSSPSWPASEDMRSFEPARLPDNPMEAYRSVLRVFSLRNSKRKRRQR